MSASGRPSPRSPADTAGTDRRVAGWLTVSVVVAAAVLLFFALAGQAGGVTGQAYQATENGSSDGEAPKLVEGARINDTAFELLITDNRDVDEGTIGASDFILEAGSISQVNATESGSNATVVVRLNRRVSIDDLTVAVAHGSDISDASGNTLDASASASSVVVSGMDGVPPAIRDFDATFRDGGPVFLSIRTSERLADLNVSVYGAVQDRLGGSDFAFNRSAYAYQTTYTPPEDGDVTFNLINATDENGNTAPVHMKEDVFVDTTPPEAVAGIDFSSSGNLTLAFDAGRSSDENGIASYEWAFGDGTTATGERVTHAFLPGNYTVSLSVVDNYGNVGTDSLELNLTAGAGNVTNVSEDRLAEIGG